MTQESAPSTSLLILDGDAQAGFLRDRLNRRGVNCMMTQDSVNATLLFRRQRPPACLIGLADGNDPLWKTVEEWRRLDPTAKIAVWVKTPSENTQRRAQALGCAAHVPKTGALEQDAATVETSLSAWIPLDLGARGKGRILVVDDEEVVRKLLERFFSSKGFEVFCAGNGEEALRLVKRERPHLMLLDIRMPGMDGVEVLKAVRGIDSTLTVIMVTANNDLAVARETIQSGASDYIVKPFDINYLETTVMAKIFLATT